MYDSLLRDYYCMIMLNDFYKIVKDCYEYFQIQQADKRPRLVQILLASFP